MLGDLPVREPCLLAVEVPATAETLRADLLIRKDLLPDLLFAVAGSLLARGHPCLLVLDAVVPFEVASLLAGKSALTLHRLRLLLGLLAFQASRLLLLKVARLLVLGVPCLPLFNVVGLLALDAAHLLTFDTLLWRRKAMTVTAAAIECTHLLALDLLRPWRGKTAAAVAVASAARIERWSTATTMAVTSAARLGRGAATVIMAAASAARLCRQRGRDRQSGDARGKE